MHFWGLTIDTVSCNNLIIAIGLCVSTYMYLAFGVTIKLTDGIPSGNLIVTPKAKQPKC